MRYTEEDWERINSLNEMYLIEKQREIEEEWQQWCEEQEREEAEIIIKTKKVIMKNETKH